MVKKQLQRNLLGWDQYPIGTKTYSFAGGHWYKTKRGWKWNGPEGNGSTFPTPGGDACGNCIELPETERPTTQEDS